MQKFWQTIKNVFKKKEKTDCPTNQPISEKTNEQEEVKKRLRALGYFDD